jgi:hypothetical protein
VPNLYVQNVCHPSTRRQKRSFDWLPSYGAAWRSKLIEPDAEVLIDKLPAELITRAVEHRERYHDIVDAASLPLRPGFEGLAYRVAEEE